MGLIARGVLFAWIVSFAFGGELVPAAGSYQPIGFGQPLTVSRSTIAPRSPDVAPLTQDKSCRFLVTEHGRTGSD